MESKEIVLDTPLCPSCKSPLYVIPVIYGTPTRELLERWSKEEIELGGCVMIDNTQPPWTCTHCKIMFDIHQEQAP